MSMMPMYLDPPSDGSQTQSPYASNDSSVRGWTLAAASAAA